MMKKVVSLELNEVNFAFVKKFVAHGHLPNFNQTIGYSIVTQLPKVATAKIPLTSVFYRLCSPVLQEQPSLIRQAS